MELRLAQLIQGPIVKYSRLQDEGSRWQSISIHSPTATRIWVGTRSLDPNNLKDKTLSETSSSRRGNMSSAFSFHVYDTQKTRNDY